MKKILALIAALLFLGAAVPMFAASEKVVDWNGKLEGEDRIPSWLYTMRRGNAIAYCNEFGVESKMNREWLIPVGVESLISWEDGLVAARAQQFISLGQTISTHINSAIGSDLSNGAKNNIQTIAVSSITDVSGVVFEGYHWYEVEKEVVTGRNKKGKNVKGKHHVWYVYAFYSMERSAYNTQLKLALQKIVKDGGFTKEEATMIAERGLKAMDDQYRRKAEFQQWIDEEQKKQRLAWERQQMGIQQQFVDQQLDSMDRTLSMAEQNQRNQNDLANRNVSNDYSHENVRMSNQNQVDNRNIDTNQQHIKAETKQIESRDRAKVQKATVEANSAATQSIAKSGAEPEPKSNNPLGPAMNDPLAFLLSL